MFPFFHIGLDNNVNLEMHPEDYLLQGDVRADGDKSLYCLAVRGTGPGGYFIFGDTLRNYYLVFDMKKIKLRAKVNKEACGAQPSKLEENIYFLIRLILLIAINTSIIPPYTHNTIICVLNA